MSLFTGTGVAMVTAFSKNGLNLDAQGKIIDHIIDGGCEALFVCGTTGEPCTMSQQEQEDLIAFSIEKTAKRVPVFVGSGGNDTAESIRFSKIASDLGADGLMLVTPYYNKCTQKGAVAHFGAIADAVNLPIVVYNVPYRTGFNLLPNSVAELTKFKNIRAVKEASGNVEQMGEIISLTRNKIDLYSGDDALTLPAIAIGAKGGISVAGNAAPKITSDCTRAALKGDYKTAQELYFKLVPFIKALFAETSPVPIKYAMRKLGFDAGLPRQPLLDIERENAVKMDAALKALGLV